MFFLLCWSKVFVVYVLFVCLLIGVVCLFWFGDPVLLLIYIYIYIYIVSISRCSNYLNIMACLCIAACICRMCITHALLHYREYFDIHFLLICFTTPQYTFIQIHNYIYCFNLEI